ncbi:O-antigen ligase [Bauldia litoralis]|uniref:O-antigen ligase n=1 Tax=Bauldia litoralis TaxID=665467 RepID=A0A1G6CV30_9HYPH|nr:O-antigen ligase [Bauldia litoralis]
MLRVAGLVVVYAVVPLTLGSSQPANLPSALALLYVIAAIGFGAVLRGAKVTSFVEMTGYVSLGWYLILLAIEVSHGRFFHAALDYRTDILRQNFVLLALPFFVIGLRELRPDPRTLEWVIAPTVVLLLGLVVYQYFVLGISRPTGLGINPVFLALTCLVWCLFLLARAMNSPGVEWSRLVVALLGLIPIALSGSKLVWLATLLTYGGIFIAWWWNGGRWRTLGFVAAIIIPASWLLYQLDVVQTRIGLFIGELSAFQASGDTSGGSFGLRYVAAAAGLRAFLDQPFTGYGLLHSKLAAVDHQTLGESPFAFLGTLHNDYVSQMVAFGVFGLVYLLFLIGAFMFAAVRAGDSATRRLGFALGGALAVYMLGAMISAQPLVGGLVFFVLGLLLAHADLQSPQGAAATATPPAKLGDGSSIDQDEAADSSWKTPRRSVLVLMLATLIGLGGLAWSARPYPLRTIPYAFLSDDPASGVHEWALWPVVLGSVSWALSDGPNGAEIHAAIDVPVRALSMDLSIRRNRDNALPFGYLVELVNYPNPAFASQAIAEVGWIRFKKSRWLSNSEPLVGSVLRIEGQTFRMGLPADPKMVVANLERMRKNWIMELTIVYQTGRTATLMLQKGSRGDAVFSAAVASWRNDSGDP